MKFQKEYSKKGTALQRIREEYAHMVLWENHLKVVPDSKDGTLHFSPFIIDLAAVLLGVIEDDSDISEREARPQRPVKEDFPLKVITGDIEEVIGYNMRDYAIALEQYIDLWI